MPTLCVTVSESPPFFRSYPANTLVILFNSEIQTERPLALICSSSNATDSYARTAIILRMPVDLKVCSWTQYLAVCSVAHNPTVVSIAESSASSDFTPVDVRLYSLNSNGSAARCRFGVPQQWIERSLLASVLFFTSSDGNRYWRFSKSTVNLEWIFKYFIFRVCCHPSSIYYAYGIPL